MAQTPSQSGTELRNSESPGRIIEPRRIFHFDLPEPIGPHFGIVLELRGLYFLGIYAETNPATTLEGSDGQLILRPQEAAAAAFKGLITHDTHFRADATFLAHPSRVLGYVNKVPQTWFLEVLRVGKRGDRAGAIPATRPVRDPGAPQGTPRNP